jgi:hypothetical protein
MVSPQQSSSNALPPHVQLFRMATAGTMAPTALEVIWSWRSKMSCPKGGEEALSNLSDRIGSIR